METGGLPAQLVEVRRGAIVESIHRGHVAVVAGNGQMIASVGTPSATERLRAPLTRLGRSLRSDPEVRDRGKPFRKTHAQSISPSASWRSRASTSGLANALTTSRLTLPTISFDRPAGAESENHVVLTRS